MCDRMLEKNRRSTLRQQSSLNLRHFQDRRHGFGDTKPTALVRCGENFCPHKGFPLADSRLYGNVVECDLHGWRFDVKSGECFTKKGCPIETYKVSVEDGWIYIEV